MKLIKIKISRFNKIYSKMNLILVQDVLDNNYRFVNLTTGIILEDRFLTKKDALNFLKKIRKESKI